jgi:hypothetical protein
MHVILDNPPGDLSLENTALLESLRLGGDAHNVLGSFPTLRDPRLARLYTPMWDLHIAEWSTEAVANGTNVTQTDASQIRQLALTDQIDWDVELAQQRGQINACGLYDLQRQPRPVAAAYRALLEEFGQITIVPHGELFAVTDQPARLKVEV